MQQPHEGLGLLPAPPCQKKIPTVRDRLVGRRAEIHSNLNSRLYVMPSPTFVRFKEALKGPFLILSNRYRLHCSRGTPRRSWVLILATCIITVIGVPEIVDVATDLLNPIPMPPLLSLLLPLPIVVIILPHRLYCHLLCCWLSCSLPWSWSQTEVPYPSPSNLLYPDPPWPSS